MLSVVNLSGHSQRGSVDQAVCQGSPEGPVAIHHSPGGLQNRVQQAVPGRSVPQGVQVAAHLVHQLAAPVNDRSSLFQLCGDLAQKVSTATGGSSEERLDSRLTFLDLSVHHPIQHSLLHCHTESSNICNSKQPLTCMHIIHKQPHTHTNTRSLCAVLEVKGSGTRSLGV